MGKLQFILALHTGYPTGPQKTTLNNEKID